MFSWIGRRCFERALAVSCDESGICVMRAQLMAISWSFRVELDEKWIRKRKEAVRCQWDEVVL